MLKYKLLFSILSLFLLTGCITFGEESASNNIKVNDPELEQENNISLTENSNGEMKENDEVEIEEEEEDDDDVEELPGLDLKVIELDAIYYDLEEVDIDLERYVVVEHEKTLYFSHELVSDIIGIDVNYNPENMFSEIFEGESTYIHEMVYPDRNSSELPVNEYWRFDYDDYWTPETGEYTYDYLEYNGKLFIPERVIEMIGDTPIYWNRQARVIEFGESSEEVELISLDYNERSSTTATPRDSITYGGKNLGSGFDLDIGYYNVMSIDGDFVVMTNGKKKTAYLTFTIREIPQSSKTTDITITTGHENKEKIQVITVSEGDQIEVEVDIAGSNYFQLETPTQVLMYVTGYLK